VNLISRFFAPCDDYIEQTEKFEWYERRRVLLVALVATISTIIFALIESIIREINAPMIVTAENNWGGQIRRILWAAGNVGLVFYLVWKNKQGLASLGIQRRGLVKSLVVGGAIWIIPAIIYNSPDIELRSFGEVFGHMGTPGFVAFAFATIVFANLFLERLLFTSFIGSRLYGIMRSPKFSIFITAIFCALLHLVVPIISAIINDAPFRFSLGSFVNHAWLHFLIHWVHAKFNNIAGPMLLHFLLGYGNRFFV